MFENRVIVRKKKQKSNPNSYGKLTKRIIQEYTEEFREIAKGNKSKEALPAGPITLIHQRPVGEELPVCMRLLHYFFFFVFFFHIHFKFSFSFSNISIFDFGIQIRNHFLAY